jgi:KUP system potassium uptake protein
LQRAPWGCGQGIFRIFTLRRKKLNLMTLSFFLSRRSLQPSKKGGMPLWQDKLFIFLARNASDATAYFQIPTDRAVEIGTRIAI